MLTKRNRLDVIINSLCRGNASEFARILGLAQTTISAWRKRDTIDYDKIAEAFPQVRAEWLLRGTGSVLHEDGVTQTSTPTPEQPVSEVDALRAEVTRLRERCDRLTDALIAMHQDTKE